MENEWGIMKKKMEATHLPGVVHRLGFGISNCQQTAMNGQVLEAQAFTLRERYIPKPKP